MDTDFCAACRGEPHSPHEDCAGCPEWNEGVTEAEAGLYADPIQVLRECADLNHPDIPLAIDALESQREALREETRVAQLAEGDARQTAHKQAEYINQLEVAADTLCEGLSVAVFLSDEHPDGDTLERLQVAAKAYAGRLMEPCEATVLLDAIESGLSSGGAASDALVALRELLDNVKGVEAAAATAGMTVVKFPGEGDPACGTYHCDECGAELDDGEPHDLRSCIRYLHDLVTEVSEKGAEHESQLHAAEFAKKRLRESLASAETEREARLGANDLGAYPVSYGMLRTAVDLYLEGLLV
jgi:hypothetical protein